MSGLETIGSEATPAAYPLRWGILSTAGIGRKNWEAIRLSGNGVVRAVASREQAKAQHFLEECQQKSPFDAPPEALGSYEELLASPEIDAVYIPLPTGLRKEWVLRAASAGKHVLCEKPCATSVAELREMISACQRHRVVFMDGVMFMHSARLIAMRALLDDGESVGPLRRITTAFSFHAAPQFMRGNIRAHSQLEPHGCLGDLGWYCIRLALWAAGGTLPRFVTGRILAEAGRPDSPAPVPVEFSGELIFQPGLSSSFYCGFNSGALQWARLDGEKGTITMDDFVIPAKKHETAGFFLDGRRISVAEQAGAHASSQETKLFRTFAQLAQSGKGHSADWAETALKTQQVLEAAHRSALADGLPVDPRLL